MYFSRNHDFEASAVAAMAVIDVSSNKHEIISSCFILCVICFEKRYICFNSIRTISN
jgi:hypothetical protein